MVTGHLVKSVGSVHRWRSAPCERVSYNPGVLHGNWRIGSAESLTSEPVTNHMGAADARPAPTREMSDSVERRARGLRHRMPWQAPTLVALWNH